MPSLILRYSLTIVSVALVIGCALLAHRHAVSGIEWILVLTAITVITVYAGTGPGIFAVGLASLSFNYFFIPPLYTLAIEPAERLYFIGFTFFACMLCWVVAVLDR